LLAQQPTGLSIALVGDAADLLVDRVEQFIRDARDARIAFRRQDRPPPDSFRHAPAAHHRPRDARDGLEIRLGSRRHDVEHFLLRRHARSAPMTGRPGTRPRCR